MTCVGEIGHMMPMAQIASALIERGHEVHFVTSGNDYTKDKAKLILEPTGCTVHHIEEDKDRDYYF